MKTLAFAMLFGCAAVMAAAQVVPAHPRQPVARPIGGGLSGGSTVEPSPKAPAKKRVVTHVLLSAERVWTSTDGRTQTGKLIAFEDSVVEVAADAPEPPPPAPPDHPTVVRDGKARLLIGKKAFEIPLTRLVAADRGFIEQVRAKLERKRTPKP